MSKKLFTLFEIILWIVLLCVPAFFVASLLHPDLAVKKHLTAYFFDIDGVIVGTPVNFIGYNIGYVKDIKIDGNRIKLDLAITKNDVNLPRCTDARIDEASLGGSRSIELMPCQAPDKDPGVYTKRPKKLNELLTDFDNFSKALTEGMGNFYIGLNASIGEKDHEDFVRIQNKLKTTEKDFYGMSADLTTARINAQKNLPAINKKMETTLSAVSAIDIDPEKIKADTKRNQKNIDILGKNLNKFTPAQYKAKAQEMYWKTEYLKLIDKDKIYSDLNKINQSMYSFQKIMQSIETIFGSDSLEKRKNKMENIKEDSQKMIKEDF